MVLIAAVSWKVTEVNEAQLLKAVLIDVTRDGTWIDVIAVPLKAFAPMVVSAEDASIATEASALQPLNAPTAICRTDAGIVIAVRPVQPSKEMVPITIMDDGD
jgi:hypothetical protein